MLQPKRVWALSLAAAAMLAFAACGDNGSTDDTGDNADATPITVVATDFQFDQTSLSVAPGETVELTLDNQGQAPHTFDSEDLSVDVETDPGESASTTFTAPDEAGTFEFHCDVHPDQMKGEIVVGDGGDAGSGSTDDTSEDTTEGTSEDDDGY